MTIVMPRATRDALPEGATYERAEVLMDTLVTIRVVRGAAGEDPSPLVARAFAWFRQVEERCSRFDPASEVLGLTARAGTPVAVPVASDTPTSYRNVRLDPARRTVRLRRPLALDLGAVAKGLAVDLAARELAHCAGYAIDAGGDLYLGGRNAAGEPWRVGLRHPRRGDELLATLSLSDAAVCTSGDYERRSPDPD